MTFWWLAIKDAKQMGRDKKALLTLVFMPILLIGILGSAFGNMFSEGDDESPIQPFTIGLVNLDRGDIGSILEKEVLEKGLNSIITVKSFEKKALLHELENQNISVGLILPSNYSETIYNGEGTKVQIISVPSATIQTMIIENMMQQFTQSIAVGITGMELLSDNSKILTENMLHEVFTFEQNDFQTIQEMTLESNEKKVSSFQYYAAGMGVMFLLMTVIQGVSAMIEEKEHEVYKRLLVSQLTYLQYLLGKLLGLLLLSTIQLMTILLGTSLLFDVHWGESLAGVFLIGFTFVFSACSFGILLGSLVKSEKAFSALGMLGTQILAAAGGSMVPLYLFPDWVNTIMRFFPNGLALQSFLQLMSGENLKGILDDAALLVLIGLLFLITAWIKLSTERRKSYG